MLKIFLMDLAFLVLLKFQLIKKTFNTSAFLQFYQQKVAFAPLFDRL